MTDLTFTINGHDYKDIVTKRKYETFLIPVEGAKYTDLDKVDHVSIVRYRGKLQVELNPISDIRAAALCSDLMQSPCTVKYYSFQRNSVVTETMVPDAISMKDAFNFQNKRWSEPSGITFTQL